MGGVNKHKYPTHSKNCEYCGVEFRTRFEGIVLCHECKGREPKLMARLRLAVAIKLPAQH